MVNSDESASGGSAGKKQAYLTTFLVSNVKPEKVRDYKADRSKASSGHIATQLKIYQQAKCGKVLHGTRFPEENILPAKNGFVEAVTEAYNHHHHLILRPDDVWLAVMTQFSFYLNDRAEEFRRKFVNFEEKALRIFARDSIYSAPYDQLVESMESEIRRNLGDAEIRDWIIPNFSTTTREDRLTAGVVFMAAMNKYYGSFFCLSCGIPSVTLDGTEDDWEEIRRRVEKLADYRLKEWTKLLTPVLDQFVLAKRGKAEVEFWKRICSYEGEGTGPRYLSGWITLFCLFDEEGKTVGLFEDGMDWPRIGTHQIPSGVVEANVTVDENGTEYKTVLLAGSLAKEIGREGTSLQPRAGWIMSLKEEK